MYIGRKALEREEARWEWRQRRACPCLMAWGWRAGVQSARGGGQIATPHRVGQVAAGAGLEGSLGGCFFSLSLRLSLSLPPLSGKSRDGSGIHLVGRLGFRV